jgi:hypothetical protein
MAVGEANNRNFCLRTNEGDVLHSYYNPTSGNVGIREIWPGTGFGPFGAVMGGGPPDVSGWAGDSVGVNCCQVGSSGTSPNVGIAMAWENGVQTQGNVYYASLTTSLTAVSTSRSLPWTVTGSVAKARTLQWTVITAVATTKSLSWTVIGGVSTSRTLPWAVASSTTAVAKTRTLQWTVIGAVSARRQLRWTVASGGGIGPSRGRYEGKPGAVTAEFAGASSSLMIEGA